MPFSFVFSHLRGADEQLISTSVIDVVATKRWTDRNYSSQVNERQANELSHIYKTTVTQTNRTEMGVGANRLQ